MEQALFENSLAMILTIIKRKQDLIFSNSI